MKLRNSESGYALLFVYMMAASVAIMMYMAIPRAAFEAQRDKEQLLIDRGEQYKRAIQLYVRKYNRFPSDLTALENTQNIRFLRRQYVDPMTGKNEWRLIHVGPGGVLLDSKINQQKKDASAPQTFITELEQIGGNPASGQNVNIATRRRPSDDGGAPGDPNAPPGAAANGPVMVLPNGQIVPATSTGIPPTTAPNAGATPPNGFPPGVQPPSGLGYQPGANGAPGVPPQPGQSPFQSTPNGPPASAANLINQILTTPRPGGLNGLAGTDPSSAGGAAGFGGAAGSNTGTPIGQGAGGQTIGGGIGGFASKLEQEGIKTYNDQTSYDKWEFVYDMSKDRTRGGGAAVPQQNNPQQPGQQPGQQPQQPAPQPVQPSSPLPSGGSSTGTGTTGTPN